MARSHAFASSRRARLSAHTLPPLRSHAREPAPAQRSLKALVADDNSINQRIVQLMLERRGRRVRVVGDGREVVSREVAA